MLLSCAPNLEYPDIPVDQWWYCGVLDKTPPAYTSPFAKTPGEQETAPPPGVSGGRGGSVLSYKVRRGRWGW